MREYKRPVVLVNEELAEGIYAASGISWYIDNGAIVVTTDLKPGTKIRVVYSDFTVSDEFSYRSGGKKVVDFTKTIIGIEIVGGNENDYGNENKPNGKW